jgi:hypothetical protein
VKKSFYSSSFYPSKKFPCVFPYNVIPYITHMILSFFYLNYSVHLSKYLVHLSKYVRHIYKYLSLFFLRFFFSLICHMCFAVQLVWCLFFLSKYLIHLSKYLTHLSKYLVHLSKYLVHLSKYLIHLWCLLFSSLLSVTSVFPYNSCDVC